MTFKDYQSSAAYIQELLGGRKPSVGLVLGSGLGSLGDSIQEPIVIPYRDIPNFPISTAIGHKGNLICGYIADHCVMAMQGRFHYFEGYPMEKVTFPIRIMKLLGVETLFVSNAAGGINQTFKVGDLMVIKDQINLLPNPLIGPNVEEFGPRFPDMTRPFDPQLRNLAHEIAANLGIELRDGVYVAVTGPAYETPGEYKFFRGVGGDAAGMSTAPEVIVARHCGLRVFGMSVITNVTEDNFFEHNESNDGEEVVIAAIAASSKMTKLFTEIIRTL